MTSCTFVVYRISNPFFVCQKFDIFRYIQFNLKHFMCQKFVYRNLKDCVFSNVILIPYKRKLFFNQILKHFMELVQKLLSPGKILWVSCFEVGKLAYFKQKFWAFSAYLAVKVKFPKQSTSVPNFPHMFMWKQAWIWLLRINNMYFCQLTSCILVHMHKHM